MARGGKHRKRRWPCHSERHNPQCMMQETKNPKKGNPPNVTKKSALQLYLGVTAS